ncbi:MAG TPA: metallophosphoesterase [Geomonas sp.]|nr:metallophosphoesterase [Geomonas sp.]
MNILSRSLLTLLLVTIFANICCADTLYQRSMSIFLAKEAKAKRQDYCFVVMGDSRGGDVTFKKALKLAKSFQPLFILHGGDYSSRGGEAETAHFLSMVRETVPELPFFVVIGNHENRSVFTREVGPVDFTVQSSRLGLAVVAVDNAEYALKAPELAYLRSRLATAPATRFVAMHVPPATRSWNWHVFTEGAEELKGILASDKVQGAFFSHVHLFARADYGGVPAIITGGAGGSLVTAGFPGEPIHHIVLVHVKNGKVTMEKVRLPE